MKQEAKREKANQELAELKAEAIANLNTDSQEPTPLAKNEELKSKDHPPHVKEVSQK